MVALGFHFQSHLTTGLSLPDATCRVNLHVGILQVNAEHSLNLAAPRFSTISTTSLCTVTYHAPLESFTFALDTANVYIAVQHLTILSYEISWVYLEPYWPTKEAVWVAWSACFVPLCRHAIAILPKPGASFRFVIIEKISFGLIF